MRPACGRNVGSVTIETIRRKGEGFETFPFHFSHPRCRGNFRYRTPLPLRNVSRTAERPRTQEHASDEASAPHACCGPRPRRPTDATHRRHEHTSDECLPCAGYPDQQTTAPKRRFPSRKPEEPDGTETMRRPQTSFRSVPAPHSRRSDKQDSILRRTWENATVRMSASLPFIMLSLRPTKHASLPNTCCPSATECQTNRSFSGTSHVRLRATDGPGRSHGHIPF